MKKFKQYVEEDLGVSLGPTNTVSGVAGLGVPVNGDPKQAEPPGPSVKVGRLIRRKYKNFMGK